MPVCLLKSSLQLTLTPQYEGSHNVYYVKWRIILICPWADQAIDLSRRCRESVYETTAASQLAND